MSLGVYPETGIKEARDKCEAARRLLAGGIDPGQQRMVERLTRGIHAENTFEAIAREWFGMVSSNWVKSHSDKIIRRLEREVFPWLGAMPVNDVPAPQLLAVLRRIEARKFNETAHRTLQHCGCVFRYAIATGRAERDPTRDLAGALAPKVSRHFASLSDPTEIGQLLRSIDGYPGEFTTACALRLSPLVFVRPGELRKAEWREIDLAKAEWRIPAARMKMRSAHIVPLARQAIAIFQELKAVTGKRQLVFPGAANHTRPMCENTVNLALRRLGYSNKEMTAHGFRSMASTLLNEQGWNPDAIERQLAHIERNAVRAAYNYAQLLPERRKMMQAWADYLVRLKEGAVSSWVRAHPATVAPAGSNRSRRGGDEAAEAFGVEGHESDLTSTQAIT